MLVQGCATPSQSVAALMVGETAGETALCGDGECGKGLGQATNTEEPVTLCIAAEGCDRAGQRVASGAEVGVQGDAPLVTGHPLTSVVVTQCNLVVAVYMTMPDGRLLRFDQKANIPADQLVSIAYTATRSERVEVSCEGMGPAGYEKHGIT